MHDKTGFWAEDISGMLVKQDQESFSSREWKLVMNKHAHTQRNNPTASSLTLRISGPKYNLRWRYCSHSCLLHNVYIVMQVIIRKCWFQTMIRSQPWIDPDTVTTDYVAALKSNPQCSHSSHLNFTADWRTWSHHEKNTGFIRVLPLPNNPQDKRFEAEEQIKNSFLN